MAIFSVRLTTNYGALTGAASFVIKHIVKKDFSKAWFHLVLLLNKLTPEPSDIVFVALLTACRFVASVLDNSITDSPYLYPIAPAGR
jgi:hypothetical protein